VPATPTRAAFFDVDGTLTTATSLFRFLEFDMAARGLPPGEYLRAEQWLRSMTASGVPRSETNRAYFRLLAGLGEADLAARGAAWFRSELERGNLLRGESVRALRSHADAGDLLVLVSGSFPACLDPINAFLGADLLLCSRPTIHDGRYTGEIVEPMIGERKVETVRAEAAARGISLARSHAYGDHESDLPLLTLVGHPVVVGDDPVLARFAARHGWKRLEAGGAIRAAGPGRFDDGSPSQPLEPKDTGSDRTTGFERTAWQ
jgi:HAD superfamily hydrolase (TIGR01490 family)